MSDKKKESFLFAGNEIFLEELYNRFIQNPELVDPEWQDYFAKLRVNESQSENSVNSKIKLAKIIDDFIEDKPKNTTFTTSNDKIEFLTEKLIEKFKADGHLLANLNPLGIKLVKNDSEFGLHYTQFGFDESDLMKEVPPIGLNLKDKKINLQKLISYLKKVFSNELGVEFNHISRNDQKDWLYRKTENLIQENLDVKKQQELLKDLLEIESFEQFIHTRYPGAKRFSVEGVDTGVVALKEIIASSAKEGTKEVIIGMAHRGRLNVLTKIMGKTYKEMFSEFQGNLAHTADLDISGDVKYHLGMSSDIVVDNKYQVHLSLTANPSHLEAANSVVQGKVRAKQDTRNDIERKEVIGILVHGEAAFCGQGVVAESLSLSDLPAYSTGGIIHIVLNNQVGFTTLPKDARISNYPTEFAKIIQAPIIHVNADAPEAVLKAAKIAAEFRMKFKKDIIIDIIGYRKYGHNEGDEPMFTQPKMYKEIKKHETVFKLYAKKLKDIGNITEKELEEHITNFSMHLNNENESSKTYVSHKSDWLDGLWKGMIPFKGKDNTEKTGITEDQYQAYSKALTSIPDGFNLNSKIKRLIETRKNCFKEGNNFDWGMGEALAFTSLLDDQVKIRMSGQDCKRGTFSHRHAVFFDQENENEYIQVNNINKTQKQLEIYNSNLSEFAVLGFEYGYSTVDPNSLTIWEAQFGDFVNGAQVIIDQFISSSEVKWLRMSGLVMLLPHGYEGQGPEHSSARPERFLQLCSEDNMQVVNCTTPANFFHSLRRQVIGRKYRKPLIVMSPKSLLRHKLAISTKAEFLDDSYFKKIIDETFIVNKENVTKIILCSGKIYYDLLEARGEEYQNIALIRLEQLYPFPKEELANILKEYSSNASVIWAQEEPQNMGAWYFINYRIEEVLKEIDFKNKQIQYVGRKNAASPAAGYLKMHIKEQEEIIKEIFNK